MNSNSELNKICLAIAEGKDLAPASEVVTALVAAEKIAKKLETKNSFADLMGTWQLGFVTGTKKTRKKAGVVLGAGRYLPKLTKITLTYKQDPALDSDQGWVENCVSLPGLQLSLTGPVKFLAAKNILIFDFTRLKLQLFGQKIFDNYLKSGKAKEISFFADSIKKQVFFVYFYIDSKAIAARGKGGGLAIWTCVTSPDTHRKR